MICWYCSSSNSAFLALDACLVLRLRYVKIIEVLSAPGILSWKENAPFFREVRFDMVWHGLTHNQVPNQDNEEKKVMWQCGFKQLPVDVDALRKSDKTMYHPMNFIPFIGWFSQYNFLSERESTMISPCFWQIVGAGVRKMPRRSLNGWSLVKIKFRPRHAGRWPVEVGGIGLW